MHIDTALAYMLFSVSCGFLLGYKYITSSRSVELANSLVARREYRRNFSISQLIYGSCQSAFGTIGIKSARRLFCVVCQYLNYSLYVKEYNRNKISKKKNNDKVKQLKGLFVKIQKQKFP